MIKKYFVRWFVFFETGLHYRTFRCVLGVARLFGVVLTVARLHRTDSNLTDLKIETKEIWQPQVFHRPPKTF